MHLKAADLLRHHGWAAAAAQLKQHNYWITVKIQLCHSMQTSCQIVHK